jgi:hypothetical protein
MSTLVALSSAQKKWIKGRLFTSDGSVVPHSCLSLIRTEPDISSPLPTLTIRCVVRLLSFYSLSFPPPLDNARSFVALDAVVRLLHSLDAVVRSLHSLDAVVRSLQTFKSPRSTL